MIAGASVLILFAAACFWVKAKQPPLDRDVILRIRSSADQMRRDELLPFD
jgi:hypothetical protein